ncbi:hypothetical protein ACL02S_09815 [Nocardia sp. 004]|uniref:hypothetical protein n=1 Tax=Nocardia sp. 004 TaxID=3385978 RepID=UPI00399F8DEC
MSFGAEVDPERIRKLVGHSSTAVALTIGTHTCGRPVRKTLTALIRRVGPAETDQRGTEVRMSVKKELPSWAYGTIEET